MSRLSSAVHVCGSGAQVRHGAGYLPTGSCTADSGGNCAAAARTSSLPVTTWAMRLARYARMSSDWRWAGVEGGVDGCGGFVEMGDDGASVQGGEGARDECPKRILDTAEDVRQ